jgi:serine/threonine protein kinase
MEDDDVDDDASESLAGPVTPSDWEELRRQVFDAFMMREHFDPSEPLVKIGHFDALSWIGEGGFGTVFKARDPKLGRLVALKLCRTRSPNVVAGIMNEAMALAQLEHANIITIFELGEHDGAVFFAMRYLAGQNAARFAKRDPPPTWREIVDVYRGVASGLAAAHARKYVHGDIKPENILLDENDIGYIADFGLARRMIEEADESEREELRYRAGTVYYLAPEVLSGGPCDARSDQFSFFVALYQTLTRGKLPFYGKSSAELLDDIEHTDIRSLIDPSWPVWLQAMLRIGLSLDPRDRFPDMVTVKAEFDRMGQMPPPLVLDEPPPSGDATPDDPPRSDEMPDTLPPPDAPPPTRPRPRVLDFITVGVSVALLSLVVGFVVGQLRVAPPRGGDFSVELNLILTEAQALEYARRGDADRALQILRNAERRGNKKNAGALAKLNYDVAVLLESHDQWNDASIAWLQAVVLARDAQDRDLERAAHSRLRAAVNMLEHNSP